MFQEIYCLPTEMGIIRFTGKDMIVDNLNLNSGKHGSGYGRKYEKYVLPDQPEKQ